MECTGYEASLLDCPHISQHNCGHQEDVDDYFSNWMADVQGEEVATLHTDLGTAYSWQEAKDLCVAKGADLCSAKDYCPVSEGGYPASLLGVDSNADTWSPTSDKDNEWVSLTDIHGDYKSFCSSKTCNFGAAWTLHGQTSGLETEMYPSIREVMEATYKFVTDQPTEVVVIFITEEQQARPEKDKISMARSIEQTILDYQDKIVNQNTFSLTDPISKFVKAGRQIVITAAASIKNNMGAKAKDFVFTSSATNHMWGKVYGRTSGQMCGKLTALTAASFKSEKLNILPLSITPTATTIANAVAFGLANYDGDNLLEIAKVVNPKVALPYIKSLPADWAGVIYTDDVQRDIVDATISMNFPSGASKPVTPLTCVGLPCGINTDCGGDASVCDNRITIAPWLCKAPKAIGEQCSYDGTCASNYCFYSSLIFGECLCNDDGDCPVGSVCYVTKGSYSKNTCLIFAQKKALKSRASKRYDFF
eukprot:gene22927-30102_t